MHTRQKYLDRLAHFAFKPVVKVLTGMRRVGKSTLLQMQAGVLRAVDPQLPILHIDKELMEWGSLRTGEDLHAKATVFFTDATKRGVLMVDEVQEIEGWEWRRLSPISGILWTRWCCTG